MISIRWRGVQAQRHSYQLAARPGQRIVDHDRHSPRVTALPARVQPRRDLGQGRVKGVVQQPLDPLVVGLVVEIDPRDRGAGQFIVELVLQEDAPGVLKIDARIGGLALQKHGQGGKPLGGQDQVLHLPVALLGPPHRRTGAGEIAAQLAAIDGQIGLGPQHLPEIELGGGVHEMRGIGVLAERF